MRKFDIIKNGETKMQDVERNQLELFYDCLDASNNVLYEALHSDYFSLIEKTVQNILAGEVLTDVEEPFLRRLNEIYATIAEVDFSVEDVRKAMQAIVLKGLKEMNLPNGSTTPDTLGIFMAYLITKLTNSSEISILDPLCGTGNLLLTIANHLDKNCHLYACDHDLWMTKLTSLTSNLLSLNVEIYFQDTFQLNLRNMDFIVFDLPNEAKTQENYFPYEAILHYKEMLKDGGAIIGIIGNDFFDYDKDQRFKKKLLEDCSIIGIVELPDAMFTSKPKSILVIEKKVQDKKNCFMVKLPSFSNVKEFNNALLDIEAWFEKNKKRSEE